MTDTTITPPGTEAPTDARGPRIGESAIRPDGVPKVRGEFAYSGDLWAEGMLWGATLRAPHPSAASCADRHRRPALAIPGVDAVLTADDVPGRNRYGLERRPAGRVAGRRAVRGRAGRLRRRRPPRDRPAGARSDRRRLRGHRSRSPTPRWRSRRPADATPTATCSGTSSSARATITATGPSSWRARTRSACRTRRSSARRPGSPSPTDDGGVEL